MSKELPPQASFWGIREQEIRVLLLITHWFNGHALTIRGEERRLATHHDLPLADLFRGCQWDYDHHEHAHQRLLANNLLQDEYVARRKIDWSPTEQGRQAIRDCLKPWSEEMRPEWADESADGPLFGDPNEGLLHRKGVEIAGHELPKMAWTHKPNGRPYGMTWYPANDRGEPCHDIHLRTNDRMTDVGVEVITANNNTDYLVDKWKRYASEDRDTFWIFDNRDTACRLFNELDHRRFFYLDGQFQGTSNWSANAINRKIWRSASIYQENDLGDLVHTVTGLLEGDGDTIQSLFEEYYSNK